MSERLDPDLLRGEDPFEVDTQAAHLFKHGRLAEVSGSVLVVPIAPSASGDPRKRRPIGYEASASQAATYRRDRHAY